MFKTQYNPCSFNFLFYVNYPQLVVKYDPAAPSRYASCGTDEKVHPHNEIGESPTYQKVTDWKWWSVSHSWGSDGGFSRSYSRPVRQRKSRNLQKQRHRTWTIRKNENCWKGVRAERQAVLKPHTYKHVVIPAHFKKVQKRTKNTAKVTINDGIEV